MATGSQNFTSDVSRISKYLKSWYITTETAIPWNTCTPLGAGETWTGSDNGMAYAAILHVGNDYSRAWQIWARRGDNQSLYWRHPNEDANAWQPVHTILDSHNYDSYAIKRAGDTITGTITISSANSDRAVLKVRTAADQPCDLYLGSNSLDKWSITCRNSDSSYILGIYSADKNAFIQKLFSTGHVSFPYTISVGTDTAQGALNINGTAYIGHVKLTASHHLYMTYNSTEYAVLYTHNNGNVSLRACGGGLYIGYADTTLINWLNGKMTLDSNGNLAATKFTGAVVGNVTGNCSGSSGSCTGNSATANYQNVVVSNEIRYNRGTYMTSAASLWQGFRWSDGSAATISEWKFGNGAGALAPIYGSKVYNAVWNDYAECRAADVNEPGSVVVDDICGRMQLSSKRLQAGAHVISDTYGHLIGESEEAKTPIGVSGRVLVKPYQAIENYHIGDALCAAPNGTADIMTREEIREYPDRIIGIVSEIPTYEVWTQVFKDRKLPEDTEKIEISRAEIPVNGRIWIYVK